MFLRTNYPSPGSLHLCSYCEKNLLFSFCWVHLQFTFRTPSMYPSNLLLFTVLLTTNYNSLSSWCLWSIIFHSLLKSFHFRAEISPIAVISIHHYILETPRKLFKVPNPKSFLKLILIEEGSSFHISQGDYKL